MILSLARPSTGWDPCRNADSSLERIEIHFGDLTIAMPSHHYHEDSRRDSEGGKTLSLVHPKGAQL